MGPEVNEKDTGGNTEAIGAKMDKDLAEIGIVVAETGPFGLWVPIWPPIRVHHWVLLEQHFGRKI